MKDSGVQNGGCGIWGMEDRWSVRYANLVMEYESSRNRT